MSEADQHRLIFFGNERLATGITTNAPVLQALIAAGYDIAAVVVAQKDSANSRKSRQLEIATIAEQHQIPVIAPSRLSEAIDQLKSYQAEAGILIAYGKIVPQAVIDSFPRGIINLHPSLLPKHRGPTPLENVILNDEKETGVSLMQLAADMDAGPIFAQETVLLNGTETKQALADQLLGLGSAMLLEALPTILAGNLEAVMQDELAATYDKKIDRLDGLLSSADYTESAQMLVCKARAYAGWPRLKTTIGVSEIAITKAHSIEGDGVPGTIYLQDGVIGIYASKGIFILDSLIPSGRKEMTAHDFLLGYTP
jgi:methionyl-tRNA formyltransferase